MGQRTERFFERGKNFFEAGNNEQALRLFNQVLNREPGHKGALKHKALLFTASEEPQKTEQFLDIALTQQPEDDELQQIAGAFYISINEFEQAEDYLKQSVQFNDRNALAHYGLGLICVRHYSDHSRAIKHFDKAIAHDAEFSEALFNRACSSMIVGATEKAKRDFQTAKKLNHPEAEEMLNNYFDS
ncbi:tetratricopeptide repeat protein [Fodinibius salsisoli]|uniref:Tetratricopeptide repeat protein n=1 Tax=Fodinibius salsisoli TaxID=2820877 RepID=A0ABT3PR08_9BACT|nr:tetratricopeptide repeat protein [Fodinibius salsisoli]MCW9708298.1 tetratricopeptide repeat protein [Fodinibius salsisoli]